MSYQIDLETRAKKELTTLPRDIQLKIHAVLEDLRRNPRPPGCKKLTGYDGYRIRQGAYRVVYTISDQAKKILVYRIGHRKDVYR